MGGVALPEYFGIAEKGLADEFLREKFDIRFRNTLKERYTLDVAGNHNSPFK
jgi:hypothetical protein